MSQRMPVPPETDSNGLLIACLCAQWCGTCKDYQPLFSALAEEFTGAEVLWVDVEDEADLVDPIEVENFPTILIAQGDSARFFGTVTPHLDTLRRLIQSNSAAGASPLQDTEVQALVQRLRAR